MPFDPCVKLGLGIEFFGLGFLAPGRLYSLSLHFAQVKRQRGPNPAVKDQVNSDEESDRIKSRERPLRQEQTAQKEGDGSVQDMPTKAR